MMLIYWTFLQVAGGVTSIGAEGGGVAFWAHLGGFLAGVVLVKLFERRDRVMAHSSASLAAAPHEPVGLIRCRSSMNPPFSRRSWPDSASFEPTRRRAGERCPSIKCCGT